MFFLKYKMTSLWNVKWDVLNNVHPAQFYIMKSSNGHMTSALYSELSLCDES